MPKKRRQKKNNIISCAAHNCKGWTESVKCIGRTHHSVWRTQINRLWVWSLAAYADRQFSHVEIGPLGQHRSTACWVCLCCHRRHRHRQYRANAPINDHKRAHIFPLSKLVASLCRLWHLFYLVFFFSEFVRNIPFAGTIYQNRRRQKYTMPNSYVGMDYFCSNAKCICRINR